jgi:hypothetical protein
MLSYSVEVYSMGDRLRLLAELERELYCATVPFRLSSKQQQTETGKGVGLYFVLIGGVEN